MDLKTSKTDTSNEMNEAKKYLLDIQYLYATKKTKLTKQKVEDVLLNIFKK